MAQPVQQVAVRSPGYQGLNTEQSPINTDPEFALIADNCVVDQIGRLTTRNAFADYNNFPTKLNAELTKMMAHTLDMDPVHGTQKEVPLFVYREGTTEEVEFFNLIPSGDRKREPVNRGRSLEITGTPAWGCAYDDAGTIVDITLPSGYDDLLTAQLVEFKDEAYLFAKGKPFCKLGGTDFNPVAAEVKDDAGAKVSDIDGDIAVSAYGRLWVSGVNGNYHEIHYSGLLNETQWYDASDTSGTSGDGGVIDVREYWPVDSDTIVNIHAHNGLLLVFGRNSILIYANANAGDPAGENGIFLQDAISNVGLVRRDAICNVGTDVLFVDESGVRSIGRVVQEKSNPIQEPSLNIRREIQEVITQEIGLDPRWSGIRMEYIPSKNIAVMLCAGLRLAYIFHLNMPSKTGGLKVTRWTNCFWNDTCECKQDDGDNVYMAGKPTRGLLKYDGYTEHNEDGDIEPFIYRYESVAMALGGNTMQTIIPKSIHYVCMGETVVGAANALWGFSDRMVSNREFEIEIEGESRYNINEFTSDGAGDLAAWYMQGDSYYAGYKINTNGSGQLFRVGLEIKVQGGRYALQEFDINSAVGRLTA